MSNGKRWPLARNSKANWIKMKVLTSSTQNDNSATVYAMKNCRSPAINTDSSARTQPKDSAGPTRYSR